jgi:hypothetical protein
MTGMIEERSLPAGKGWKVCNHSSPVIQPEAVFGAGRLKLVEAVNSRRPHRDRLQKQPQNGQKQEKQAVFEGFLRFSSLKLAETQDVLPVAVLGGVDVFCMKKSIPKPTAAVNSRRPQRDRLQEQPRGNRLPDCAHCPPTLEPAQEGVPPKNSQLTTLAVPIAAFLFYYNDAVASQRLDKTAM